MRKYIIIFILVGAGLPIPAFINIAVSDTSPAEAYYQSATTYHDLGEFERAISEYRKAIALNPNSPIIFNRLGVAYSELKQYDAALDAYKSALALSPMTAEPHYNIGLVYLKKGDLPHALKAFKRAIAIDTEWGEAYTGLGEVYLKQGDFGQAIRAYKQATRLNPNGNPSAILGLGKVYARQERWEDAITAVEKAIEIHTDNTEAHYQLAQIYIKRGEKKKATAAMAFFKVLRQTDPLLKEAEIWVKRHPNDARGYNNLGIVYLARRRPEDAIANYKHAISLAPDLATAHYNLGHAYHKQGKMNLAISAYKQALTLDPTLAIAHNNVAVCYIESGIDLDQALSHARTAVRLVPTASNYWDTLSQVCTALGLESEARHAHARSTKGQEKYTTER
ncbi:MAG: tetratricopeptide repeat protein [Candidatus Poribacteria bacterium]|nr:tetratricopeptide repeat protein [Candidatus Poribacteria bacterium]